MAVFRVEKTKDYTVMSNYHLRDRSLSLKAKGLLSLMLSLPENWDFTMKGLACICQDGLSSVRSGVAELEQNGYLTRRRIREANGQLSDIEYTIHEKPQPPVDNPADNSPPVCGNPMSEKPICENPTQVNPTYGNRTQLSIQGNQELKKSNIHESNIHQSIRAKALDEMDKMERYSEIIKENIEYDCLCQQFKFSNDEIEEIFEIMLEAVCSKRETIRIGGEDKPAEIVRSRLLKLDSSHIQYVMETLSKNTTEVRNIKSYLLTTLFNAPATIGNYYKARVNYDMYGSAL